MYQRDKNSGESYATPPNGKCLMRVSLSLVAAAVFGSGFNAGSSTLFLMNVRYYIGCEEYNIPSEFTLIGLSGYSADNISVFSRHFFLLTQIGDLCLRKKNTVLSFFFHRRLSSIHTAQRGRMGIEKRSFFSDGAITR